jgi:predicted dinucleotide-binding enzyme
VLTVNVNLDSRRVESVELSNSKPETIQSLLNIRDVIDAFSEVVSERLSPTSAEKTKRKGDVNND